VERVLVLKKTGTLGLTLPHKASSASLWIAVITDGLLQKWNDEHPEQAVILKDRLIGVNGITSHATQVLDSLREAQDTAILTVLSYNML